MERRAGLGARFSPWLRVSVALFSIGWGANQFASLLIVYRRELSATQTTGLFGVYALGLMPALLIAAPLSDRYGRRAVLRVTLVLSIVASLVLAAAAGSFPILLVGRLLAGVAAGAAFGPGTAWIKELSTAAGTGDRGARRAATALTGGFAAGPFVAGIVAQWLPRRDELPYAPHLVLAVAALLVAWGAPDVRVRAEDVGGRAGEVTRAIGSGRFLGWVVPTGPWVFGSVTTALAILPEVIAFGQLRTVASGVAAVLTLGAGVAVQPLAQRLDRPGSRRAVATGIGCLVSGLLVAALTAWTRSVVLLVPSCLLLGASYGFLLITGLRSVELVASTGALATVTGIFYCLTYVGFGFPLLSAALAGAVPLPFVLLAAAVVASVGWVTSAAGGRRG